MPSGRAGDFRRVAERLGLNFDARPEVMSAGVIPMAAPFTIPIHGGREIGPPLFYRILEQLGISADEFRKLK
jgi:hypothetical protein